MISQAWIEEATMTQPKSNSIFGAEMVDLAAIVRQAGEPPYRARQLFEAMYGFRAASFDDISTLPKPFRLWLVTNGHLLQRPKISRKFESTDGTIRYLIEMIDGETVETVWMPEGDDGESGDGTAAGDEEEPSSAAKIRRATVCVSSQVGCAVNCQFCLTAQLGVRRNLSAGEIVGQVLSVLDDRQIVPPQQRVNLVFMGMGEPFLNYDNFMRSVRLLVEGVGIPESRMTVSTAGIVPRIVDLGRERIRPKLAISLNAPDDAIRESLMPINHKWNLEALCAAARAFPLRAREKITFEYVLLGGVNDAPEHARQVARLVRDLRAKVNLIALNPGPGLDFGIPLATRVLAFQKILIEAGIPTFIRRPRGRDIFAACGQLKRTLDLAQVSQGSGLS
jgi:23S rRNA (adenine2503-C2)-methyltransferase